MNINELNAIKDKFYPRIKIREGIEGQKYCDEIDMKSPKEVLVCAGAGCAAMEGETIADMFEQAILKAGVSERIKVVKVGCVGLCSKGPNVVVYPDCVGYVHVRKEDVEKIVESHFVNGVIPKDLVYDEEIEGDKIKILNETPFYKNQVKIALRNCGTIELESIDEYIAHDGYFALEKCISNMTKQDVIDEVMTSNIRGRGGAGFPAGKKWESTARCESDQKYIVCNADEGNPGATMDRAIMEGDPHSVLEGMAIAGYAVGASKGYIYCRAEYPVAVKRLNKAIKQAKEYGCLGDNIFGSDFSFDIEVRLGAGAFVCGESTALMESIEGKRGMPRPKVYRTAERGLWGKPTVLNNVETLSNIPGILRNGGAWYASIGTEKSTGTKVFSLDGKVNNTGLVEVPLGIKASEIVYNIGGGMRNGKQFKGMLTGGPAGGVLPLEHIETGLDFDSLKKFQSILGSGDMIVLDEDDNMVDVAKYFMDFTVEESCGKCVPCREGTKRMLEMLERILEKKGVDGDIERLESLADTISSASLCGLGQCACTPVLSTLMHFREEYEELINANPEAYAKVDDMEVI